MKEADFVSLPAARVVSKKLGVQVRFLLGPAGSGKTYRCLSEIRAALAQSPEGPPLLCLAPKQATFQLERQLLADDALGGYTRLRILSFERLAEFVFDWLGQPTPTLLSEEGRVMVLRALLQRQRDELRIFRASARLPGFASQLSQLLRDLQRHQLSAARADELAEKPELPIPLKGKLHDVGLMLRAYLEWLTAHNLEDADHLLDLAAAALRASTTTTHDARVGISHQPSTINHSQSPIAHRQSPRAVAALWLDGFAEMTPQELDLLTALVPWCEHATLAFCLDGAPPEQTSWLSMWSVIGQTCRRCCERLSALSACEVTLEVLARDAARSRFVASPVLQHLEASWAKPEPFTICDLRFTEDEPDKTAVPDRSPAVTQHAARSTLSSALRLAACANPEAEAVLGAQEILRHIRSGGRFRDCAVLLRSLEGYADALRRVFTRYEIPFFLDRRESIAHHPVAELTRYALRVVALGWEHDDWFGALKTGLVHDDDAALDRLENEALARGWRGNVWLGPLPSAGHEQFAAWLERLRQRVVPPFQHFAQALDAGERKPTGAQLAAALCGLWGELQMERRLERWSEAEIAHRPSPIAHSLHATAWEQMNEWLRNLELAFRDEPLALSDWLPIIEAGLANLTVGVVPPALDQVLIGTIDRSRNPDLQLALVLGLNESVFPAPPALTVLLSEADRRALTLHGTELGPDAREQIGRERFLAYIACTRPRRRLVLTCAARDAADNALNPSPFLEHVQRLFPGLERETFAEPTDWTATEHLSELIVPLLKLRATQPPAEAAALATLESLPPLAAALAKHAQLAAPRDEQLPPVLAGKIYGAELATSVSALEDFAACPFKFFVGHGLAAEERKQFEVDRRERGSFQHEVLKEFHRRVQAQGRRWRDLSPAEARALVRQIGDELTPAFRDGLFLANAAGRFTAGTLIAGLEQLMETLVGWTAQYQFDPHAVEVGFGLKDSRLPGWRLDLGGDHALVLRGRIDRVDLCRVTADAALVVIVDYKSSARELDAVKLHHGLELQLLAYLGALSQLPDPKGEFGVARLLPAGVSYVSLKGGAKGGDNRVEAQDDPQTLRTEGCQHRGRFDGGQLERFDNRGVSKGDQFRFSKNKDGEFSKRGNEALPAEAFGALLKQVEDFLRRYGQAIYAGDARVAPYRKGTETACDFCDYRPICRFDPWTEPYRVLRPPSKPSDAAPAGKTSARKKP